MFNKYHLTGRNTTGSPSRAAPWWFTLHMHRCGVLQRTTDDDEQRARDLDIDLGSGRTAYRHASLVNLYLHTNV